MFSSRWVYLLLTHPQLPYGTMTDDEMRAMPIPTLQDEGLLFLWVTGRAMEVGRECLRVWGYTRVDEVVWVKTNQVKHHLQSSLITALIDIVHLATTRYPYRTYWSLAEPHQGAHARGSQDCDRRGREAEIPFMGEPRARH